MSKDNQKPTITTVKVMEPIIATGFMAITDKFAIPPTQFFVRVLRPDQKHPSYIYVGTLPKPSYLKVSGKVLDDWYFNKYPSCDLDPFMLPAEWRQDKRGKAYPNLDLMNGDVRDFMDTCLKALGLRARVQRRETVGYVQVGSYIATQDKQGRWWKIGRFPFNVNVKDFRHMAEAGRGVFEKYAFQYTRDEGIIQLDPDDAKVFNGVRWG